MKVYEKYIRAVAHEVGDPHAIMDVKYYDWYKEDCFPPDMEKRVEMENPWGGWYKYEVEEKYLPVGEVVGGVLVRKYE